MDGVFQRSVWVYEGSRDCQIVKAGQGGAKRHTGGSSLNFRLSAWVQMRGE